MELIHLKSFSANTISSTSPSPSASATAGIAGAGGGGRGGPHTGGDSNESGSGNGSGIGSLSVLTHGEDAVSRSALTHGEDAVSRSALTHGEDAVSRSALTHGEDALSRAALEDEVTRLRFMCIDLTSQLELVKCRAADSAAAAAAAASAGVGVGVGRQQLLDPRESVAHFPTHTPTNTPTPKLLNFEATALSPQTSQISTTNVRIAQKSGGPAGISGIGGIGGTPEQRARQTRETLIHFERNLDSFRARLAERGLNAVFWEGRRHVNIPVVVKLDSQHRAILFNSKPSGKFSFFSTKVVIDSVRIDEIFECSPGITGTVQ